VARTHRLVSKHAHVLAVIKFSTARAFDDRKGLRCESVKRSDGGKMNQARTDALGRTRSVVFTDFAAAPPDTRAPSPPYSCVKASRGVDRPWAARCNAHNQNAVLLPVPHESARPATMVVLTESHC
jgi:hypothetical protein